MLTWPLLHKNKVEDSKVSVPVRIYTQSQNEVVKALAQKVSWPYGVLILRLTFPSSFLIIGTLWKPHTAYQRE